MFLYLINGGGNSKDRAKFHKNHKIHSLVLNILEFTRICEYFRTVIFFQFVFELFFNLYMEALTAFVREYMQTRTNAA